MRNFLFIFVASVILSGCIQTREQAMQVKKEEDYSELQMSIEDLTEKLDELSSSVATLSENIDAFSAQHPEITTKAAEEAEEASTEESDEIPPSPPIVEVEKDILEEPEAEEEGTQEVVLAKKETPPLNDLYQKAFGLYKEGSFDDAIALFDSLVAAYPDTDYTDNAIYWKGECYYSKGEYSTAIAEFERVVEKFPEGNKAPDAQLKVGFAYIELKDNLKAKDALQKTMDLYPFSDSAKTAAKKLDSL